MKRAVLGISAAAGFGLVLTTAYDQILAQPEQPVETIDWDRVADCRSGNNWEHPPVRRNQSAVLYRGGLMIPQKTWIDYGGQEYAISPEYASRDDQIRVAERILADPLTEGETGLLDGCP